jgi:hypothetical protein
MPRKASPRRRSSRRGLALAVGYVAWALACAFALGGGWIVLLFFCVWGAIWFGFALFSNWANRTRRLLLKDRGYY